jgi:hypothetical protein
MLHTEGGAKRNCVAAERRGEAAIASDCVGTEKRREKVVVLRELERAIIYNE